MFQVGEYIVCDHNGVCRVLGVSEMPELKKGVLYYQLEPVYSKGSRIFVPVDSDKLVLRRISSADEVEALLDEIPSIETIWISNEKKREEEYREVARRYECREWVKIIKTIYLRKKSRRLEGKKITYIDEKYMKLAEDNLYGEISIPLHLTPDKVEKFIRERINKAAVLVKEE
ncbi:CarD family transcriptional regulator [Qiania dongpingensis]|uniref:CarD family transcriptional regulator n=1 Tax=Qiania dongpingensis TaxID=2763669 RepID=A0A7G9G567_9FIRM|nr:CarD family transcriptional regulator [Qiania dongpingensis]QNM05949.1 CarD family transcriptional regulator [Qiania dongpingensis]